MFDFFFIVGVARVRTGYTWLVWHSCEFTTEGNVASLWHWRCFI